MSKKKEKQEKIVYVDDGRTIADMSGVTGGRRYAPRSPYTPRPSFKEVWNTYWSAVKMMLAPMTVVVVGLLVIYVILWIVFKVL